MKTFSRLLRRYLLAAVGIVLLMFVLGTSFFGWVLWREGQRPQREYSYSNIADSMVQTADGLAFGPQHTPEEWMDGYSWAMVLDADGLNAAADLLQAGKTLHPKGELILTPHPGEMARLTGRSAAEINADREGTALRYAKAWNAVVVLKGAHTVIAGPDGRCAVNPTGNPGLSRGGSGDALAGMTAALLACGLPAYEAAACAVYLHGAAADRAAALRGEYGMLPQDLFAQLGRLFAEHHR